jgi:hypothetical protein
MIRIGSIVLRVDDLQRQTEFWEAALGYARGTVVKATTSCCSARPTAPQKYGALMEQSGRNQRWPLELAKPIHKLTHDDECDQPERADVEGVLN